MARNPASMLIRLDVRFGSLADITRSNRDVRFALNNDINRLGLDVPLSANGGHRGRYSITSSARASSVGEISMSRALAVFKFMTNSYFVGACTGRSAGFSPLRIRST